MMKGDFVKMAVSAAAVIFSFSLVFILIQQLTLKAASHERVFERPRDFGQMPPVEVLLPAYFRNFPEILPVEVRHHAWGSLRPEWLSAEEAAWIASGYIENLMGHSTAGKTLHLSIIGEESGRPWWQAQLAMEIRETGWLRMPYSLSLDAVTGQLLEFFNGSYFEQRNIFSQQDVFEIGDLDIASYYQLAGELHAAAFGHEAAGSPRMLEVIRHNYDGNGKLLDIHVFFQAAGSFGQEYILTLSTGAGVIVDLRPAQNVTWL